MENQYIYLEPSWYTWKGTPIEGVQHQIVNNVRIIKDEFESDIYEFKDSKGDIFFSKSVGCLLPYNPDNKHLVDSIFYYQHHIDVLNDMIKQKTI